MDDPEKLSRLAALARDGLPDTVDPARDEAGIERLVAAVTRGATRAGATASRGGWGSGSRAGARGVLGAFTATGPRWAFGLAAAAALAIGLFAIWPAPRLSYMVDGAPGAEGAYIAASGGVETQLRFGDGSTVGLAPGGSLRVAEVASTGARVLLEDGRATLQITPRPKARWSVEAGPFAVLVTGTAFDIAWTRSEGTLRVDLREGAVTVRGPLAPDGLPLRAGQRLVARLREGELKISSLAGGEDAAGSAEAGEDATGGAQGSLGGAQEPPGGAQGSLGGAQGPPGGAQGSLGGAQAPLDAGAAAAAPSWTKRVARGDFQAVLAEAEQRGLDAVIERGALDDLVALGDAARYAKRGELAQRALVATRKRFPGTGQGKTAAFLLGRMIDGGGSPAAAIAWYDTYLSEAPGGPFAAEALGRKMLAVERTAGAGAARPIAALYLKRYPQGAHAALAQELVKP